jgi:hypothetical protein
MSRFHITRDGDVGPCRALKGNCPFGGESGSENHFDSVQEATEAFEALWSDMTLPTPQSKIKEKLASRNVSSGKQAPEVIIPDPTVSKVIKPPEETEPFSGYMGSNKFVGGKVAEAMRLHGSYIPTNVVTAAIRDDIKSAIKAKELPSDVKYGVRKDSGRGVDSVTIFLSDKNPDSERYMKTVEENGRSYRRLTAEGESLTKYVNALGNQWATDESNSQYDYFNYSHRARVYWQR